MRQVTRKTAAPSPEDSRPSKGQLSRETILLSAAQLATTTGLAGLSIGDLAAAVGMSKSGLYAHFKSKEELELATIETAVGIFDREVLQPALKAAPGVRRLRALVNAFLGHVERRVFPGGCFFAAVAAELDTRPGAARDRISAMLEQWLGLLKGCLADARAQGEIDAKADLAQATFETEAMLLAANFLFVMTNDPKCLAQSRKGFEHVVARLSSR